MKFSKKAFTLIELLVVIAIIGILATISVVAFQNARAKARDAKRIADAKQMQTALEMFFNDQNRFPTAAEFNSGSLTIGDKVYMMNLPTAPSPADGNCDNTSNQFSYTVNSAGTSFAISYCLGSKTGALDGGPKCLTRDGFSNSACGASSCISDCSGKCTGGSDGCGGTCTNNCDSGLYCHSGTCGAWACGDQMVISSIAGHTCAAGSPNYDTCTYDTLDINGQCWFKQNLNVGDLVMHDLSLSNDGILEKHCFWTNTTYCQSDGALYEWNEAMQYSTTEGAQGICPSGWHIPTDADQYALENYLKDAGQACNAGRIGLECSTAGAKLRAGGSSGFEGILAGYCNADGSCYNRGTSAMFWSSKINGVNAYLRSLDSIGSTVFRYYNVLQDSYSIRCIKS